jgi:predicted O-methyltransferase YrrM
MAFVHEALELIRKSEYEAGAKLLAGIAASSPEQRREALGHRAWLINSLGRLAEAEIDWRMYLELAPEDTTVRCMLAECVRRQGRLDEAAGLAVDVLKLDPMSNEAINVLKSVQAARGLEPVPHLNRPVAGELFPALPINRSIEMLEATNTGFAGSVHPVVGRFLYSLVRLTRPKTMIETGSWIGYSALCIAQALEDNGGGGHLHSFDVFGHRPGWGSPITGPCEDSYAVANAHAQHANLAHRLTFHQGDSSTTIRHVFKDKPASFDLAYIDGDHRLEGVVRDWRVVDELISEGGLMLLHDTNPDPTGWYGPRYLLEELREKFSDRWHVVTLPTADRTGMALMQKISKSPSRDWKPPFSELLRDRLYLSNISKRIALGPDAKTHKR